MPGYDRRAPDGQTVAIIGAGPAGWRGRDADPQRREGGVFLDRHPSPAAC